MSHSTSEVARLATTVIALDAREAGAVLTGRLVRHHEDGLPELDTNGVALFLRRVGQV